MLQPKTTLIRPRRRRLAGLLAGVLLLPFAPSPAAAAPEAEPTAPVDSTSRKRPPGPLRIDIEPTIADAGLLRGWITTRNPSIAQKVPMLAGHEQWIAVEIGGITYDYTVSVVAMRDGKPLGALGEPLRCECNSEQLLELVDEQIDAASEELRSVPPRAEVPEPRLRETAVAVTPVEEMDRREPTDDRARRRRMGALGSTGLGVAVLGAGAVGAGVVLMLRPDEVRGDQLTIEHRSTRNTGIAVTGVAGVVFVAGLSLLVVDLVRHRRSPIAVVPSLGLRHAGMTFTQKF